MSFREIICGNIWEMEGGWGSKEVRVSFGVWLLKAVMNFWELVFAEFP